MVFIAKLLNSLPRELKEEKKLQSLREKFKRNIISALTTYGLQLFYRTYIF